MAFNLKKILRALLFSTSDALTIKDIQAVITRYHDERENMKKAAKNGGQPEVPEALVEGEQSEMEDIMAQVPTLLTATQIREAMEEISAELEESGDVCRLLQSSSGFKLAISKDYAECAVFTIIHLLPTYDNSFGRYTSQSPDASTCKSFINQKETEPLCVASDSFIFFNVVCILPPNTPDVAFTSPDILASLHSKFP